MFGSLAAGSWLGRVVRDLGWDCEMRVTHRAAKPPPVSATKRFPSEFSFAAAPEALPICREK